MWLHGRLPRVCVRKLLHIVLRRPCDSSCSDPEGLCGCKAVPPAVMKTGTTSWPVAESSSSTDVGFMDHVEDIGEQKESSYSRRLAIQKCLQHRRSSSFRGTAAGRRRRTQPPTSSGRTTAPRLSASCAAPSTSTPRTTCCPSAVRALLAATPQANSLNAVMCYGLGCVGNHEIVKSELHH